MSVVIGDGVTGGGMPPAPHVHLNSDLTELNFVRVVYVASSGAEFTNAQLAIDTVDSGLSESAHAAVLVYVDELPEDLDIPPFVHVIAMGMCKITGTTGNPTVPMVTMAAASSLRGFRLENQDTKDIGIRLEGGGGTDVRALENITITNLVTSQTLTEGIVVATTAGIDVITFNRVDVLLSTAGTCIRKETAAVELFTFGCIFKIFSGGGDAIQHNNGNWFAFGDCVIGPVVLTSPGVYLPSGTNYDQTTVSGDGTLTASTPAESVSFVGTGLTAGNVKLALDEAYGTVDTVDPDNNDDLVNGFSVLHKWLNSVTQQAFISVKDVATSAIWKPITGAQLFGFDANKATFPPSNPAGATSRNGHPVLAFDDSTDETVIFHKSMSHDYADGDLTVDIDWVAASATTGDVKWDASFERAAPAGQDIDADGFAVIQTATDTTNAASGVVTRTSITFTQAQADAIAAGDSFRLKITRDTSVGGDMTGDAQILRVAGRQ